MRNFLPKRYSVVLGGGEMPHPTPTLTQRESQLRLHLPTPAHFITFAPPTLVNWLPPWAADFVLLVLVNEVGQKQKRKAALF